MDHFAMLTPHEQLVKLHCT